MRNRKILVGTLILAIAVVSLAAFMVLPSAKELLVAAGQTLENATDGHAIVAVKLETPPENVSGTVELWGKTNVGPSGEPAFRVVVLEASKAEAVGVTAVADGTQFWLYNPQENKVFTGTFAELKAKMAEHRAAKEADSEAADREGFGSLHGSLGQGAQGEEDIPQSWEEAVDRLLEYMTAERTGSEDVGDLAAYRLRLVPIPEKMPDELRANGGFINLWLGVESQVPVAVEYAEGAVGYAKATASVMEINQGIDNSIFVFEIPAGAEVISIRDWEPPADQAQNAAANGLPETAVLTPASLPDGAQLTNTLEMRGAVVQQFSLANGRSFTVAQGQPSDAFMPDSEGQIVTVRRHSATLYTDPERSRTLVTWVEGDVQFWVGGDLTAEQAIAVAESLQ